MKLHKYSIAEIFNGELLKGKDSTLKWLAPILLHFRYFIRKWNYISTPSQKFSTVNCWKENIQHRSDRRQYSFIFYILIANEITDYSIAEIFNGDLLKGNDSHFFPKKPFYIFTEILNKSPLYKNGKIQVQISSIFDKFEHKLLQKTLFACCNRNTRDT